MPMIAQLEAGVDQRARDLAFLVHLPDQRAHPLLGELAHLLAEHALVLGEVGQRKAAERGDASRPWSHLGANLC